MRARRIRAFPSLKLKPTFNSLFEMLGVFFVPVAIVIVLFFQFSI